MSFGKMNTFIEIITTEPVKDSEGFVNTGDTILASVRAYKEDRHGNEKWANRAAYSTATALFKFRFINNIPISTAMFILCNGERYNILSVDNVRNRNMYYEVLAEKTASSMK